METKKLFILFSILLSMVGTKAFAYDIAVENADGVTIWYNYINDGKELEVTHQFLGYSTHYFYSGSVVIPEEVTYKNSTRKVTSIGWAAFYNCSGLTSVTIPNSVTSIGNDAFHNCSGLTSVTIPNSVTSIGVCAFNCCEGLTSVNISDLAAWCKITFDSSPDCNPLYYAHHLFLNGVEIKDLVIPNSVTSIENNAFSGCSGLTSVTIPNSVTSIGNDAFSFCSGLFSITIPNSVTSIGDDAFEGCRGLTSITIPNSVTSIGGYAFCGCHGLTSVTIPNSVMSIGKSVFQYCSGLTSVTIGNSVTSIGDWPFYECSSLTYIIVEEGNPNYDSRGNCNALIETATNTLIAGCKASLIPNSVTSIGDLAFYKCSDLTSVEIPNSVTSIGDNAFGGCSGLSSVTIGNSVTSIGGLAFGGCSSLTSVTIPASVTSIGEVAFYECSGLTSVEIPNSVTSIGEWAFNGCDILSEVISGIENPFVIAANTFSENTFNNATLYVPEGTIGKYKATKGWNKFALIEEGNRRDDTNVDVIKITSAGQTTWCSAYDLDFTDVEGLKAYTATGYHRTNGTIWLTRVKEVPAGEGILLIGDAGDYKIPHVATTAYYANLMVGTVKAITINETDGEYTNYYLSNGASGVGFYKVNGSVDLKANRAYLPLLKNTVSSTRGFIGIDFDDDSEGTTGIGDNNHETITNNVWYNLQGQRVDNPGKGIYIKNGRKVVIK